MGKRDADDVLREEGADALRRQFDAAHLRVDRGKGAEAEPERRFPLCPTAYVLPDPSSIPPRSWLYSGHYIRGVATATVAPGGTGKTTLTLYECIMMAVGGLNAWYLSGEDPRAEIDRRIAAHCLTHEVTNEALGGRLHVDDRVSFPFFIGKPKRNGGVEFDGKALAAFEAAILARGIDAVALDPLVSFHTVPENDNGAVDGIVKRLALIAQRTNSCIELSHHVRKPAQGQAEITVDDTRGGSAIVAAVRSCRVINRITATEAEQAKIKAEDRHLYVRVDIGKRNMAPPEKAEWYRIRSVHLPNGDNVQAMARWEFPKIFDGLSVADIAWVQDIVREGNSRADSRSDKWLGHHIAQRLDLDVMQKGHCIRINKIIATWLQNGVIAKAEQRDPDDRKKHTFYVLASAGPQRAENGTPASSHTHAGEEDGDA